MPLLVQITDVSGVEFAQPDAGRIEDEQGEPLRSGENRSDGFDVFGQRGDEIALGFVRQSYAAGRVGCHKLGVEDRREIVRAFPDRLALVPLRVKCRDDVGDVGAGRPVRMFTRRVPMSGRTQPSATRCNVRVDWVTSTRVARRRSAASRTVGATGGGTSRNRTSGTRPVAISPLMNPSRARASRSRPNEPPGSFRPYPMFQTSPSRRRHSC